MFIWLVNVLYKLGFSLTFCSLLTNWHGSIISKWEEWKMSRGAIKAHIIIFRLLDSCPAFPLFSIHESIRSSILFLIYWMCLNNTWEKDYRLKLYIVILYKVWNNFCWHSALSRERAVIKQCMMPRGSFSWAEVNGIKFHHRMRSLSLPGNRFSEQDSLAGIA